MRGGATEGSDEVLKRLTLQQPRVSFLRPVPR
jgi:hypothetical protein